MKNKVSPPVSPRANPQPVLVSSKSIELTSNASPDTDAPLGSTMISSFLPLRSSITKHSTVATSLEYSGDRPDPPPDPGLSVTNGSHSIHPSYPEEEEQSDDMKTQVNPDKVRSKPSQSKSFISSQSSVPLKDGTQSELVVNADVPQLSEVSTNDYDASAYLKQITIDRYGFPIQRMDSMESKQHRKQIQKEKERLLKWENMLFPKVSHRAIPSDSETGINWKLVKSHRKMKPRIRKGIPHQLRGAMWQHLSGAHERRIRECSKYGSKRLYTDLTQKKESPFHEIMWKDINRTYRTNLMFGAIEVASRAASEFENSRRASTVDLNPNTNTMTNHNENQLLNDDLNEHHDQHLDNESLTELHSDANRLETTPEESSLSLSVQKRPHHQGSHRSLSTRTDPYSPRRFYKHALQNPSEMLTPRDLEKNATPAQYALYNVLKSFSLFYKNVGYCQGMQSITALLLMYMTEEEAFWVLVSLADNPKYQMAELWKEGMPGLHLRFYQLQRVIQVLLPKLSAHLEANDIVSPSMYQGTQWFMTVFLATDMKFGIITRIWDIYLNEGWKIVFRMAIGYLKYFEREIMAMEMHEILMLLRTGAADMDEERYIKLCFATRISRTQLVRFEEEYNWKK